MGNNLTNWEIIFEQTLQRVAVPKRKEAGALLSVIPDHAKWDEFLATVKAEWNAWRGCLEGHAICLIVLYGGLAYYEYDEKTFWPHFAKAVGSELIFPNQQTEINRAFSKAAELLGFPIHHKVVSKTVGLLGLEIPIQDATTSYVGSAVYHIGIPLSLWDGFLEICEWAWWRDDWNSLTADEWVEIVRRRTGGRNRLKKFLIENREITGALIKEMLDARKILSDDASLTIADLSKACLLRTEYFDEVPETAEFLRPQDPESLLHDRPQLVWNDQRSCICLNLPGLPQNKLPATWHIDNLLQDASSTPHQLVLNSVAFQPSIHLKLVSGQQTETQRLRGVQPWGFFDLDAGGQLVNSDREQLPLRSYALVSRQRIESITRVGFDEEENPVNEPFELGDGTQCFVTDLWPTGKFAEISLGGQEQQATIRFRTNSKIEARFFVGAGSRAANFSRLPQDEVKIEEWPILCLAIPRGYYRDNQTILNDKFRVLIDGKLAFGRWETRDVHLDDGKDFYVWNWSSHPLNYERKKSGIAKSFRQIREFIRSPVIRGKKALSIQAPGFGVQYKIYLDDHKPGMDECWENLPGTFLPWFLLCQTIEGMKWDDLLLAQEIIAPNLRLSAYLLRKYEKYGLLVQRGRRWMIAESRAVLNKVEENKCLVQYCGDPSLLWGLYRRMSYIPGHTLPMIEVINKRNEIPYLQMIWGWALKTEIEQRLRAKGVLIGPTLWNP